MALGPVRRTIVSLGIAADLDTVWDHLRDPAKIRRWFGWHEDSLDLEIAQLFIEDAAVAELAGASNLEGPTRALSWRGGDLLTVRPSTADPQHRTLLTVERHPYDVPDLYEGYFDAIDESWIGFSEQLRFALERHPGQDRRMLRAGNLDAGPLRDRLLDRVGLHGLRGVPVGGHLEVHRADGSVLGGTIWHRTRHQVGVRLLPGLAESLLVIEERPGAGPGGHGLITAALSTYGVEPDVFAEMARRWYRWWGVPPGNTPAEPQPLPTRANHRRGGIQVRR